MEGLEGKVISMILIMISIAIASALTLSGFRPGGGVTEEKELLSFSNSWGGNMNGNSHSRKVALEDEEHAIISVSDAEWYFQDSEVKEYRVDRGILKEIGEIFWKERMDQWVGRTFSDVFVADGETESYYFYFEEDSYSFSSQIFGAPYGEKLKAIDSVLQKYLETAELLPGLQLPTFELDSWENIYNLQDGVIELQVYEYAQNTLSYRLKNGTDADVEWKKEARVTRLSDGTVLAEIAGSDRTYTVSSKEISEKSLELEERLEPGEYQLEAGGYSVEFEIG